MSVGSNNAVDYSVLSPRYSVNNNEELENGIAHLNENGYSVFSDVLSSDDVSKSINLFWEYLENLPKPSCVRRNKPETWTEHWPGIGHLGILNNMGIGQSEFLWFVRGNPNIKKVFSKIWNENELFVSFDGAGCFRNWSLNPCWRTITGWLHCDQNPFIKPNRCSIQGLVALTDNDETTGGLVVIPHSHKRFSQLQLEANRNRVNGDFIRIPSDFQSLKELQPRLVKCRAGDLVVWDSRCIHCNTPAIDVSSRASQLELLRLVCYICMSPLSMFKPNMTNYKGLKEFRQLREQYVQYRITCTHWPLELVASDGHVKRTDKPLKLNAFQYSLVIGTNVNSEDTREDFIF